MSTNTTITYTINAVDQASSIIGAVGNSISRLGGPFQSLGRFLTTSMNAWGQFSTAVQAGASALNASLAFLPALIGVVIDTTQMIGKMTDTADSIKTLSASFNQLKGDSELSLEAMQKAADGTISKFDLLTASNQAMITGIDPTALPTIMELARKSADAMGITTVEAFNQIADSIGKGQERGLKNFGITVDQEAAYNALALTLGKTASELSEAEKQQAFENAAMEAAIKRSSELGDVTDSLSTRKQQLSARIEDMQAKIGDKLLPVMEKLYDVFGFIVDIVTTYVVPCFMWYVDRLTDVYNAVMGVINAIKSAIDWFTNLFKVSSEPVNVEVNENRTVTTHYEDEGVPNIPGMQHGGIVEHPTLALIGERGPEAVIPLNSKINNISDFNPVQPIVINNNIQVETLFADDFQTLVRKIKPGLDYLGRIEARSRRRQGSIEI